MALAACSQAPAPPPDHAATAQPDAAPPATERREPALPAVTATPASQGTPSPAATASPASSASPAGAVIYRVDVSPSSVRAGQSVVWSVRTSPAVTRVTARTALITLPLTRVSPGHFALTFAVPQNVPFFFHRSYDLDVEADAPNASAAHRSVRLTFL